ncbi:hypothetical protein F2Q68_00018122 [Brassica cretica]|uniref:Uncharacterized protein n=1 Tax=Brassica cretica TaxID=69181 RepID=A0A8S9HSM9_BRACR|nr:hypothetical protein F2Q68_00018122 [Brassica cretica]
MNNYSLRRPVARPSAYRRRWLSFLEAYTALASPIKLPGCGGFFSYVAPVKLPERGGSYRSMAAGFCTLSSLLGTMKDIRSKGCCLSEASFLVLVLNYGG